MNVSQITPSNIVRVLRNVPLDGSYKDTLTFSSVSAQSSYFIGKTKQAFTDFTPVRMQNAIRFPVNAQTFYDCNYIMFQNANFGNKWFYAFITSVDYININMCQVRFDLDIMQTWYFDYTLKPSFVEREHVNDDTIGANLVPENVELGEYVFEGLNVTNELSNCGVLVCATESPTTENEATPGNYNGVFSGVGYYFTDSLITAGNVLTDVAKPDSILSVTMFPKAFVDYDTSVAGGFGPVTKNTGLKNITFTANKNTTNIGGYTPKNKKLFTYPYNFLYCTNFNGNSANFRYEYFTTANCDFRISVDVTPNPTAFCVPLAYKGISVNYNEKITLNGWPQCAWASDVFKAYLAQNATSTAVNVMSSAIGMGMTFATGGAAAAVASATTMAGTVAKLADLSALPPQAHGTPTSNTNLAAGTLEFGFSQCHCDEEFLKIIDDYFNVRGYAVHEVKIPNRTGRQSWNYVKTIDCKATGSIPFDDLAKIRSIYDSGITFWHGDYVGDYSRSNNII